MEAEKKRKGGRRRREGEKEEKEGEGEKEEKDEQDEHKEDEEGKQEERMEKGEGRHSVVPSLPADPSQAEFSGLSPVVLTPDFTSNRFLVGMTVEYFFLKKKKNPSIFMPPISFPTPGPLCGNTIIAEMISNPQ